MPSGLGSDSYKEHVEFYHRMCVRKGSPKAVMVLAHHMVVVVYQILSRGEEYVEMGGDYYDRRNKPKVVARLEKRLTNLGYWVQLQPIETVGCAGERLGVHTHMGTAANTSV